jgi:aminoglycoside phosphotransferase (APT) family kinase protein
MSMEYYPSVTLKAWLTLKDRPFELRLLLAQNILKVIVLADHERLFHGDLHTSNILIHQAEAEIDYIRYGSGAPEPVVDFRVIDFGTSYFSKPGFSLFRHWRILEETIDHLLHPLKMRPLWYHVRPAISKIIS